MLKNKKNLLKLCLVVLMIVSTIIVLTGCGKKDNKNNTFPLPIIVDGKVNFDNLYSIKKSNNWLLNTLFSRNIKVEDVFYSFYQNNELYIIKNNDIKN